MKERNCRLADLPAATFDAIVPGRGGTFEVTRRRERAGGIQELRLDRPGGSGAATGRMEIAASDVRTIRVQHSGRSSSHGGGD